MAPAFSSLSRVQTWDSLLLSPISFMKVSPRGVMLAAADKTGLLLVLHLTKPHIGHLVQFPPLSYATSAEWISDCELLIGTTQGLALAIKLRVWRGQMYCNVSRYITAMFPGIVSSLSWKDGMLAVSFGGDVEVWTMRWRPGVWKRRDAYRITEEECTVIAAFFLLSGELLIVYEDHGVSVWEARSKTGHALVGLPLIPIKRAIMGGGDILLLEYLNTPPSMFHVRGAPFYSATAVAGWPGEDPISTAVKTMAVSATDSKAVFTLGQRDGSTAVGRASLTWSGNSPNIGRSQVDYVNALSGGLIESCAASVTASGVIAVTASTLPQNTYASIELWGADGRESGVVKASNNTLAIRQTSLAPDMQAVVDFCKRWSWISLLVFQLEDLADMLHIYMLAIEAFNILISFSKVLLYITAAWGCLVFLSLVEREYQQITWPYNRNMRVLMRWDPRPFPPYIFSSAPFFSQFRVFRIIDAFQHAIATILWYIIEEMAVMTSRISQFRSEGVRGLRLMGRWFNIFERRTRWKIYWILDWF